MKKRVVVRIIFAVLLIVLLFPIKNQHNDGGTTTYTSLTYKVIVWRSALPKGFYKTGTEIYFFPNNFNDLDYYLENSYTSYTNSFAMEDVVVSSGGKEIIPYMSWSHGTSNGIAADAIGIRERGIEDKLETIEYADDFEIKIGGNTRAFQYDIYTEDFKSCYGSNYSKQILRIPEEPGTYIVRVQLTWWKNDNNTAYDYVFKLAVK